MATFVGQDDIREIYATLLVQLLSNDMHKLRTFDPERGNRFEQLDPGLTRHQLRVRLPIRSMRREPRTDRAPLDEAENLWCDRAVAARPVRVRANARRARDRDPLRAFSDKDREFVTLYFGEGLDAEQIAKRMQISVKTVYSKKHKIQSRLEQMLHQAQLAA